ncbi:MAG: hypothetical protein JRJ16_03095 [Deltaproteobacteria bacterium]|nr:hypothetical protein [Deltaproteobacteria bacterium]
MISPPGMKTTDMPCLVRTSPMSGIMRILRPLKSSMVRQGFLDHMKFSMLRGGP